MQRYKYFLKTPTLRRGFFASFHASTLGWNIATMCRELGISYKPSDAYD